MLAIVCNSINPDLVNYFHCKIDSFSSEEKEKNLIVLKNQSIKIDNTKNVYNSSFTESAFFDTKVPIDFLNSFYIFAIIIMHRVKIIHFTTAHISNLFLSLMLKPFNIKQIFTIHDLVPHPGKKAMLTNLYNKIVINVLSDEIISFSKKEIKKQIKINKFKYMTLAGFPPFTEIPKIGEKTILFFGRIESYKGLNNLLELIQEINQTHVNYKFIIAGKGLIHAKNDFEKISNVEIINRFIDDQEVTKLFQQATFTILPYDSATQSGVTILSYAYATPVIAYDIGSLSEYIKHERNGFIVNYQDNSSIIGLLAQVTNEEILKMSQECIDIFRNLYSKNACQKQYHAYYQNLIGERK